MFYKQISFFSIIFLLSINSIIAQEIGKIFPANVADSEFGQIVESKQVESSIIKEWLNSTNDKVMFKLENNNLIALGDQRNLLFSNSSYSESNEVFHMYSKSKVLELLKNGGKAQTYFENRAKVFSITNGDYTLEASTPCPPFCK